nr:hypothetical protein [Tanacetum cinerariifolium]
MVGPSQSEMGEGSAQRTIPQHTPTFNKPPQHMKKTQKPRKPKRKATKIESLERRVKKLKKKKRSRTYKIKRLYKVGLTARVISSSDDEVLDKEDASKHGRINEIDNDKDIALVSTYDDVNDDEGIEVEEEEVVEIVTTAKMIIDSVVDVAQVTTAIANILISAAEIIFTTAPTTTAKNITQAPKVRGVMIQEPDKSATPKIYSSQPLQVKDKSKGKAIMIKEPKVPKKRKKLKNLKTKSFSEIQKLFDIAMKRVNDFVDFKTKLVEGNKEKKESKVVEDDGDDVTIDATPLTSRSLTIVDYKIYKEGREDLEVLWRIVKEIVEKTQPVDYMDNFILHTLKTMFEHHVDDNVWKHQQGFARVKN